MKSASTFFFCLLFTLAVNAQIDQDKVRQDLDNIISNLKYNYVYFDDKGIDLECIKEQYSNRIPDLQNNVDVLLFFEYLLCEFNDNHMTMTANTHSSYRLFAPIYVSFREGIPVVANVWQTQIEGQLPDMIGAELVAFNGTPIDEVITDFPTQCADKDDPETREWMVNKVIWGRYDQPRVLTLKRADDSTIELNLDEIKTRNDTTLLDVRRFNNIGIIRINNSLGNDDLVTAFDTALDNLFDTEGLIIDLRNTLSGGDSYEAKGIMSRFIDELRPYQQHSVTEKSNNNPAVERLWIEYVTPRGDQYKQPVVLLVGRWTGSMGEGLAIGFEGMGRGEVVGSEMRRLAGEVWDFGFEHLNYGYKLPVARLSHINGTPRELYVPTNYVNQTSTTEDETLHKGIELIKG